MGHEVMEDTEMSKSQIQVVVGGTSNECKSTSNHSSDIILGKRKLLNGYNDSTCSSLKNYSNFMKSSPPKRILFHENGVWNDFPQGLVDLVREDFLRKKAVIQVQFDDITVMLNMSYMVQVDPITGTLKPIAWIDDSGSCYFPELYSLNAQKHQLCLSWLDKEVVTCQMELNGARGIKLHIGIDLNGLNNCNLEKCMEGSNVDLEKEKSLKIVHEISDKVKTTPITDIKPQNGSGNDGHTQLEPAYALLDAYAMKRLFYAGMLPFINGSIIATAKFSSKLYQMRLELFEKQVEITSKCRGNSNVQYAWFPCSKADVSNINSYGIWHGWVKRRIKYGNGVHLSAVNRAYESAKDCDADENGRRYMVFCRVILGNVEVLYPESQQWHPSSETFDSGVDSLENPSSYIIWNMNASTQISPEYAVSFKIPAAVEGSKGVEATVRNNSGVTVQVPRGYRQFGNPSVPKGRILQYLSSQKLAAGNFVIPSRSPPSPSMNFLALFIALTGRISAKDLSKIYANHRDLQCNRITKAEFIRKLRQIVNDKVMMCVIRSMQNKRPPKQD